MKKRIGTLFAGGLLLMSAQAATIDWTTNAITGFATDVLTNGITLEAINGAATSVTTDPVINGVTFTSDGSLLGNNWGGDSWTHATAADADYDQFLSNTDYQSNGTGPLTVRTFTGLTVGAEYLIQYWFASSVWENTDPDRYMVFEGTGSTNCNGYSYATGIFTADATTQDLIVSATHNGVRLTGYQLRAISGHVAEDPVIDVSEPSLDFGVTYLGYTNSLTVTVENVGGLVLEGTASVSAPFYIESGATYSLSAGQQQVVTVLFAPEAEGEFTNTLSFTGGDGTNITVVGTAAVQPPNAVISWTGYESTGLSNEVVNAGVTVEAINADPSNEGSFTVNGVEFQNSNAYLGMGAGNYFTDLTSDDPGYQQLIESTDYDNNTLIQTITLTGLEQDQDYLIQYWYMANTGTTRTMTLTASGRADTGAGDLTLTAVDEGTDLQYAVGTFTAAGGAQDFTFIASANGVRMTAFQLRQLSFGATEPVVLFIGPDATGTNMLVNWNSESNLNYAVLNRMDLTHGDWSTVSSNIPATPPMNTYTGLMSETTGFYKVIVE